MPGKSDMRAKPTLVLPNADSWSQWLSREAETSNGVWLVLAKKTIKSAPTSLTYDEALDEALCYGWIDGQGYGRDDTSTVRHFSPRRPKSMWSKRNVGFIARLEGEGRMQARGLQEVERAKADGRWSAAYSQANMEPPQDLLDAIASVPAAQAQWDVLTKTNKFAVCFRLASLKTEAGRTKRLAASIDMLTRGETYHPQKRVREDAAKAGSASSTAEVETKDDTAAAATSNSEEALSVRRSKRRRG